MENSREYGPLRTIIGSAVLTVRDRAGATYSRVFLSFCTLSKTLGDIGSVFFTVHDRMIAMPTTIRTARTIAKSLAFINGGTNGDGPVI